LFGLANILLKILSEQSPDYAAAAFDRREKTFRKEIFESYKINRPPAPEDLISQIIEARNLFRIFNIKVFEMPGFEADDLIGTLAEKLKTKKDDLQIIILTGDLDSLQLVQGKKVIVEILKKGISETEIYDEEAVIKRYNLKPELLSDYKGLVGDKSDNIPGVKNIGPKTAEKIINKYGSLESAIAQISPQEKGYKEITAQKETAILSKKLATIKTDVQLEVDLEDLNVNIDTQKIRNYFEAWDFKTLISRLEKFENKIPKDEELNREISVINAFYVRDAEDLKNNTKFLSKNTKVSFDWKPIIKKLLNEGVEVPKNIFDLKIAYWLLNPDEKKIDLEKIIQKTGKLQNIEQDSWKNAFILLKNKLKKNQLQDIFEKIEIPLIEVLSKMEINGIKVNLILANELISKMEKELKLTEMNIFNEVGAADFNINSPKQLSAIIFKKLKINDIKKVRTKSGINSTSFDVLSRAKDNPLVKLIIKQRELSKILNTYLKPIKELVDEEGKIHTTYNQTKTATGRLSSEKPNLQNIPNESIFIPNLNLRNIFEAEEGFEFASFDYSQLEIRLLADITGDENLISAFNSNEDIHTATASKILKIPQKEISEEQRKLGKILNFGIIYGMGPRSFSKAANVEIEEAKKFIEEYFKQFPKIKKWQNTVIENKNLKGFVENKNGRKRWFSNKGTKEERAAINMPIQSFGADILKKSMIQINNFIKENKLEKAVKMILTIHDELMFEIQNDMLKEIAPKIKAIMENVEKISVPLLVEVKTGKSWGSLKKYKNV